MNLFERIDVLGEGVLYAFLACSSKKRRGRAQEGMTCGLTRKRDWRKLRTI